MASARSRVRLRQAVWVAAELEPLCGELERALGVTAPFHDPGVGEFGLRNAVYALGDCFLEVVAPTKDGTAAGRYLERFGPGGYMALFDLEDLDGARARVEQRGIRIVWQIDLPDIAGTHLHPGDMPGVIVSLDRSDPYGTWRWGGPDWTGATGPAGPGHLDAIVVAVEDPAGTAERWGAVLGVEDTPGDEPALALDGDGAVRFQSDSGAGHGIVAIEISGVDGRGAQPESIELGGVVLHLRG
jgi:hypothetical protein